MMDQLWTHLSGRVDGSMNPINELAQTNAQISERDQVPWSACLNKRTHRQYLYKSVTLTVVTLHYSV